MRLIFAGTPEFAAVSLKALIDHQYTISAVYTQPDRPAGRGRKLTASPVKRLALQHDLNVLQPASLNTLEQQEKLRAFNSDLMIVAAYGLLLPKAVLALPRYGCINIHASWLPRWRGAAPIQRAILAGDTETGISIIQMDAGIDTGAILNRQPCLIKPTDTTASLLVSLAQLGSQAILQTLTALSTHSVVATLQDSQLATYATKIVKAEAKMNWQQDARELERLIRAFNPWPVAYTDLDGSVLRVWQAQPLTTQVSAAPGTIVNLAKGGIDVACGTGLLRLTEIQWPNVNRQCLEHSVPAQHNKLLSGARFTS